MTRDELLDPAFIWAPWDDVVHCIWASERGVSREGFTFSLLFAEAGRNWDMGRRQPYPMGDWPTDVPPVSYLGFSPEVYATQVLPAILSGDRSYLSPDEE